MFKLPKRLGLRAPQTWLLYTYIMATCNSSTFASTLGIGSSFGISLAFPFGVCSFHGFASQTHGLRPWNSLRPNFGGNLMSGSQHVSSSGLPVSIRQPQPKQWGKEAQYYIFTTTCEGPMHARNDNLLGKTSKAVVLQSSRKVLRKNPEERLDKQKLCFSSEAMELFDISPGENIGEIFVMLSAASKSCPDIPEILLKWL